MAAAKCEYGVAKQKKVYVEQTAAIVASTTILSFVTRAFVVVELNEKYPEVFDLNKSFHFSGHEADADPDVDDVKPTAEAKKRLSHLSVAQSGVFDPLGHRSTRASIQDAKCRQAWIVLLTPSMMRLSSSQGRMASTAFLGSGLK